MRHVTQIYFITVQFGINSRAEKKECIVEVLYTKGVLNHRDFNLVWDI